MYQPDPDKIIAPTQFYSWCFSLGYKAKDVRALTCIYNRARILYELPGETEVDLRLQQGLRDVIVAYGKDHDIQLEFGSAADNPNYLYLYSTKRSVWLCMGYRLFDEPKKPVLLLINKIWYDPKGTSYCATEIWLDGCRLGHTHCESGRTRLEQVMLILEKTELYSFKETSFADTFTRIIIDQEVKKSEIWGFNDYNEIN